MRNLWRHLQVRWGVSVWGVVAILLAFSLAGSTVLKISRPIMNALVPPDTPRWVWWTVRIVVIVPVYEVLLLCFGFLLGQWDFFWPKQKRLLRLIARPLRRG